MKIDEALWFSFILIPDVLIRFMLNTLTFNSCSLDRLVVKSSVSISVNFSLGRDGNHREVPWTVPRTVAVKKRLKSISRTMGLMMCPETSLP